MFRLQHQFNNIVETTQLNIDQMLEFHCYCDCLKCSPHHQLQATITASSHLIWEIFYSLVDRSLWQVAPDNLKRFIEFGLCFQLCFKLAVSLQHCTPYVIVHWVYLDEFRGQWSFVMISGQLARSQFCAQRGVARCVCWRAILLKDESGGQLAIAVKEG